ncbi:MAG: serine/threonine-protein kinase, partial [Bradymonadaceae bacterium]
MNGNGNDNDEPSEGRGRTDRSTPSGRRESRDTPGTDPNLGAVFDDRYRIDEQIGVGGMGVVYRAVHTGLDRDVVVKLLSRDHLENEAAVQRFRREARTLGRLDHPNIVSVYDFGYEDDVSYIVMEYVDGERLDEIVQREGPLGPGRFFLLASQILDAVGQAHREGLAHRDLKPANVMVVDGGNRADSVKVLDFGLAKLVSGENDVTKQQSLVGSMPYLSPEQIRGDEIDQRIDVYALGILFYYMLAGRKPFRGKNASIIYDQVHSEPPPLQLHVP